MNPDTYGLHLTLRMSEVENRAALNDVDTVKSCIQTIVNRIGMRVLAGPLAEREDGPLENTGCSAVIILYESHAAIHTYAPLGQAFVDIFSCKEFDTQAVITVLNEFFGEFQIKEHNVQDRGIHWGADVKAEMNSWMQVR
jgi:S-adenosylmethionine decarboxylase